MSDLSERDKRMLLHGFGIASSLVGQHLPGSRCYRDLLDFVSALSEAWGIDPVSDAAMVELNEIVHLADQAISDAKKITKRRTLASILGDWFSAE